MQGIILSAGESTRTRPLTYLRPKSLLPLCGRAIIEHTVSALVPLVEEIIIVVGYRSAEIIALLGDRWQDRRISYVHQEIRRGSGDALLKARD